MSAAQVPDPIALEEREEFARQWEAWHQAHEETRTDRRGILAATGLHWLGGARLRVPGVPGAWATGPDGPLVELDAGESLTAGGRTLTGTADLSPLLHEGSVVLGFVDHGVEGAAEVSLRGSGVMLRPRRTDSAYLDAYSGTRAYPADPQWAIPARLVPAEEPAGRQVGSVLPGLHHTFSSPGVLEFEIDGRRHRLTAFAAGADGALSVLFRDATSGVTTYSASRTLAVAAPAADGTTVLDFNRATNLPCAYTDFSTCPLPPAENTLGIMVDAGEKMPGSRVPATAAGIAG